MSFSSSQRLFLNVSVMALMFLGTLTGVSLAAARSPEATNPPTVSYDARTMDADIKTHVMHLTDVIITYGKMTVRADRAFATAGDFKNSRWTFDGNVRINAEPRGTLRSDEAVVEFEDNQLKRATATGAPAEFDQKREDSDLTTHGHAKEIVYEVGAGTVRLSNDAWVSSDKGIMTGPEITYNLRDEHVEASTSTGTERVHVTIPASDSPKLDGANKPKPTAGEPGTADPPAPGGPASTGGTTPALAPTAAPVASPPSGAPQSSPH